MIKTEKYCITTQNILSHEIIGLNAKIEKSTDPNKKGLTGKIVDETQKTFKIETKNGEKIIPKKEVELTLTIGEEKIKIEGKKIVCRPEDRIKKFGGKTK